MKSNTILLYYMYNLKKKWLSAFKMFTNIALQISQTYNFSIKIDEAPPPPLQIDARPFSPAFKACTKCTTIRAPDILKY